MRKKLVRATIATLVGVDSESIEIDDESGIITISGDKAYFVVASAQHTVTEVRTSNSGWVWYANLDSLVSCGWVPAHARASVEKGNSGGAAAEE